MLIVALFADNWTVTYFLQALNWTAVGTGFGSMTFSAIPEPSACAAFAGLGMLGFAAWRRRARARISLN